MPEAAMFTIGRLLSSLLMVVMLPLAAAAQEARPLLVFAAASLQPSLTAIARKWQATSGRKVACSFASSAVLARQIAEGAPAELFASADLDWMDWAQQRNLIKPATRKTLLGNTLVLIAAADWPGSLRIAPGFALAEAIGDSRLATGIPQSVPAGRYAKAALTSLGVWDRVAPKIAGTDNVRAALNLVARGEARFGIVYATDARSESKVRIVDTFPADSHPPVVYPFAVTSGATSPDATAFLEYLSSPPATLIFEAEGFSIVK